MAALKNIRAAAEELSGRLELPTELDLTAARLTVVDGRQLLLENHRGLLSYGSERMVIAMKRGRLCLTGSGLSLLAMNRRELLIGGKLQAVEWEA